MINARTELRAAIYYTLGEAMRGQEITYERKCIGRFDRFKLAQECLVTFEEHLQPMVNRMVTFPEAYTTVAEVDGKLIRMFMDAYGGVWSA